MFSLTYKSEAHLNLEQNQIETLLRQSRKFNSENGITGCLLYHQGVFLQYIEGTEDVVMHLFRRIKKDERHRNIVLLSYDYILARVFKNWVMAYEDFTKTNHDLEYLKFMITLFIENPNVSRTGSPTAKRFWGMVKQLLSSTSIDE